MVAELQAAVGLLRRLVETHGEDVLPLFLVTGAVASVHQKQVANATCEETVVRRDENERSVDTSHSSPDVDGRASRFEYFPHFWLAVLLQLTNTLILIQHTYKDKYYCANNNRIDLSPLDYPFEYTCVIFDRVHWANFELMALYHLER